MSGTGRAAESGPLTQLVVVADGVRHADAVCDWLSDQLTDITPERVTAA